MILIMKKSLVIFSAILLAGLFNACKNVPQAELDSANSAIDSLKVVQADVYLADEFLSINDSLSAVKVEIENQKGKMFGSYGKSKEKLVAISNQATELVAKTEVRKQEIKGEIETTLVAVQTLIDENLVMIENAPKGKEGKQAIEAITVDLSAISTSISEIPAMVENGELIAAHTKIMSAQKNATEINAELKTVMEKYKK